MQAQKRQAAIKPVSLKLRADLKARVDAIAAATERTAHKLMQDAIEAFVERAEREEKLWLEALASYEDYELTGLHLDQATADAWMAQLEVGNDIEPPPWQS
jgi:predicted transcriptional regulator